MPFPFGDQEQLYKIIDAWFERHFTGNYLQQFHAQTSAARDDLKKRIELNVTTPESESTPDNAAAPPEQEDVADAPASKKTVKSKDTAAKSASVA